jgi:hypothetical protein
MGRIRRKYGGKNMPVSAQEDVRAVRLELPLEIHKQFRIEAAKEDTSMASIARRLVEEWVAKRKVSAKGK